VVLGPLLLQGSFGLPQLGIAGLGVANLLGSASALCALVVYIYVKRLPIALHGEDIRHLRPDPVLLGLLARRGVPMAMETLVVQGSYFALLALVNSYGAATAAAYSGAAQLWIYVQMPSNALATSMSTMAAMNIGASQWDRVEKIALRGCLMGLAISAFATAVIYALGDAPLRLFIPEGGEVLEKARHINSHALWGWIALSASMGLFGVIRANGAMLAPMLIFAVTMWGIRVPFAVLLRPWLGEDAIWWSFPFGSIFSAAIAWAYYCWGGWRRQALMLAPHATPVEELL
jgi:Na+-driven multidrug efflux pump